MIVSVIEPSLPEDPVIVTQGGDKWVTDLRRLRDSSFRGRLSEVDVARTGLRERLVGAPMSLPDCQEVVEAGSDKLAEAV
ncbi:MAG TPA: hypothetical protein VHS33_01350 [Sphingomicrobium sp.]|nr:hypothetical protein [Sphingomicrobium sp.]